VCVVCQKDIAVGHLAVSSTSHSSRALHESYVRPNIAEINIVIQYCHGTGSACPHCRNPIIPPSSLPPQPPPLSRSPRVPLGSAAGIGSGFAHQPIDLDETDAHGQAPPPHGRAPCALCRESFGSTLHFNPHVRLAHPSAPRMDIQRMGIEACLRLVRSNHVRARAAAAPPDATSLRPAPGLAMCRPAPTSGVSCCGGWGGLAGSTRRTVVCTVPVRYCNASSHKHACACGLEVLSTVQRTP
jgi:hypothetical protein